MAIRSHWRTALWCALVLLFAGFPLFLPVFPSGDGAVHLYYSDVVGARLLGTEEYEPFQIVRYFPPYALVNYYLAFATRVLPGTLAERTLVSLIVILFATGYRRLAAALGNRQSLLPLLVFPLAWGRYLFTGFYSFCLGSALLVWAIAWWIENHDRLRGVRSMVFLALAAGLYLSHPIPFGVAVLFFGVHLGLSLLFTPVESKPGLIRQLLASGRLHAWQFAHIAITSVPAWYVKSLAEEGQTQSATFQWSNLALAWREFRTQSTLAPHDIPAAEFARIALLGMALALAAAAIFRPAKGVRRLSPGALLIVGFLLVVGRAIAPGGIAGAVFFGERFTYLALVILAGAGAVASVPRRWVPAVGVAALCLTLVFFYHDARIAAGYAMENRVLVAAPTTPPGSYGAILLEGGWIRDHPPGTRYTPCLWSAARYFQRSKAVLTNAPWLHQKFWMVGLARRGGGQFGHEPPFMPDYLAGATAGEQNANRPRIDFLIGIDCAPGEPRHDVLEQVAGRYGLVRMPWSTRWYEFYAQPELALQWPQ